MTLINKIREKSGVAVGVIAVAMGMFVVGGDLLSGNSFLLNNEQIVGEIAGKEISLQEFNSELEYVKRNYTNSTQGQLPSEAQMPGLRTQAWNNLISKYAYEPQYEDLGIRVSEKELEDMVQGDNLHPGIANSFADPATGEVDRERLNSYFDYLKQLGPNSPQYAEFVNFEQRVMQERRKGKYEDLLGKTYFATSVEAQKQYKNQNNKADISFLYVPFTSVKDDEVEVTDADLKAYYNENKEKYDKEANRAIEYVRFEVKATNADRQALRNELNDLKSTFATTSNDTAFVEANSDATNSFLSEGPGGVPSRLKADQLEKGKVFGPFQEGQSFKMYKVIDVVEDSVYSAKASHILFKAKSDSDEDKREARNEANKILREIKGGADFAAMAREHGTDGTKNRGGDLGWFDESRMVAPFSKAVFDATSTGLLPRLVETDFGFHIIKVDETKVNVKYVIGIIEKEISPSDETIDAAYRQAGKFSQNNTSEAFDKAAEADSTLIKLQALTIRPDARNINNINTPRVREVIRWAYSDDTSVGDVSEVYDLDDQFIIARLMSKREKGTAPFEDVKDEVKKEVLKEKKAQKIIAKLQESSGTLEERKTAYGTGAEVQTASDISMTSGSVTRVGFAPKLIGKVFSMKQGETSLPIEEGNGVVVVEVTSLDEASEVADYTIYRDRVKSQRSGSASFKIGQAMKEFADVEDNLYKYF